jgi:hypothetical protein
MQNDYSTPLDRKASDNPYLKPGDSALLQRYLGWAAKYYDRANPELRADMVAFDRWFYSRQSIGFIVGIICGLVGIFFGIKASGTKGSIALLLTAATGFLAFLTVATVWFGPLRQDQQNKKWYLWLGPRVKNPWLASVLLCGFGYVGAVTGAAISHLTKPCEPKACEPLSVFLRDFVESSIPVLLAMVFAAVFITAITLVMKSQILKQRLDREKLNGEAQAQDKIIAQSRLKVLQAQIKPHFLFNTLAALQYWVDTNDQRASLLLKNLSGFLRTSTELIEHDLIPVERELQLVERYLKIMQLRLGNKLTFSVECEARVESVQIPPAIMLSMVENAIEHGIEPSIQPAHIQVSVTGQASQTIITISDTGIGYAGPSTNSGDIASSNAPAVALNNAQNEGAESATRGVGLSNSLARLKAHFGNSASLSVGTRTDGQRGTTVAICVPVI